MLCDTISTMKRLHAAPLGHAKLFTKLRTRIAGRQPYIYAESHVTIASGPQTRDGGRLQPTGFARGETGSPSILLRKNARVRASRCNLEQGAGWKSLSAQCPTRTGVDAREPYCSE